MSDTNPNLIPYRVMLHQEPGDKFQIVFDCMAECDDHAVEQAENAYPGCEIMTYLPFDQLPLDFVIYSANESALGKGFWSNEHGWVDFSQSMRFTKDETERMNLPVSTGQDAKWVLWEEANASYGAPDLRMEVSLDGGRTWQPAHEGVRIAYKNVLIDGEDGHGEVHINATHEGLITDIWTSRDEPLDHNIGTESLLMEDLVTRLVGEND